MAGIRLYKKALFTHSVKSTIVKGLNNAPVRNTAGLGGVDHDVRMKFGGKNMRSGKKEVGWSKFRMSGICCGISAAWIVAFLGGNSDATDHDAFKEFFEGSLRFQGSYVKFHMPNQDSVPLMMKAFGLELARTDNDATEITDTGLAGLLPLETQSWAGYVVGWTHAIAIGYKGERYYIVEPNGGLFEYRNNRQFVADLTGYIIARRDRKAPGAPAKMKAYFYSA
ncbi:MAG: hypothetical protein ACFB03_13670 [Paracoccaceae bacterium]